MYNTLVQKINNDIIYAKETTANNKSEMCIKSSRKRLTLRIRITHTRGLRHSGAPLSQTQCGMELKMNSALGHDDRIVERNIKQQWLVMMIG